MRLGTRWATRSQSHTVCVTHTRASLVQKRAFSFTSRPCPPRRCIGWNVVHSYNALLMRKLYEMGYPVLSHNRTWSYRFITLAYPSNCDDWMGGGGAPGGWHTFTWGGGVSTDLYVVKHEYGHNFGFNHALTLTPPHSTLNTANGEAGVSMRPYMPADSGLEIRVLAHTAWLPLQAHGPLKLSINFQPLRVE